MHLSPARVQRLSEKDKDKLRQVVRTHCRQRHFQDISDGAAVGRSLWRAKGRTIVWDKLPDFAEPLPLAFEVISGIPQRLAMGTFA